MNGDRWERLTDLYHAAVALTADERASLFAEECPDDPTLRSDVERMIAAHDRANPGAEPPATATAAAATRAGLAAGDRLGAYRVVKEIGHGPSGVTYLAERDDGRFEQRGAVKVIDSALIARETDAESLLGRVRSVHHTLGSRDHPNIARLIDAALTDGGQPYLVTDYVEGEAIDAYADARRLSIPERLQVFVLACNAVSYVHRRRVVHGGLKPANILVTAGGVPKLVDVALDVRADTPAVDIHALGVLLDLLLTGGASNGAPRRLRGALDAILRRALETRADRTYETVERLADDVRRYLDTSARRGPFDRARVRAAESPRRRQSRAAVTWAVAAVAVAALGIQVSGLVPERAAAIAPAPPVEKPATRDRLLVADFTDRVGDPELAAVLSDAFRVGLTESRAVEITTRQRAATAIVTGSIDSASGRYTIMTRITWPGRQQQAAPVREVADAGDVMLALGRLAERLREQLGESSTSIEAAPRLEAVGTASLPAQRSYANAVRALDAGDRAGGVKLLKAAIALDTGFAAAHRLMAVTYGELGDRARSAEALDHAIANQARLPFYERNYTIANHAMTVLHNYATAVDAYNRILERNPGDVRALSGLASAHAARREYAVQESLFTRAIAADSGVPSLYTGLALSQVNQGKYDQARRVLDKLDRRFPGTRGSQLAAVALSASKQDWDSAERGARANLTGAADDTTGALDGLETVASIAMSQGRLAEAQQGFRRVLALGTRTGPSRRVVGAALRVAYLELRYHHAPAAAVATMNAALARAPFAKMEEVSRPYDAVARLFADAGQPRRAKQILDQAAATAVGRQRGTDAARHWALGAIAMAEGRVWEGELEINQAADNLECPICALPDLARSYEVAGKPDSAIATYERYLTTPWQRRYETDDVELGFAMKRLGELYQQQNDRVKAAAQYKALLQLWRGADAELEPLLADVRRRLEQTNDVVARR
jgi:tetratricopeptide (TPR) repeat protein